MLADFFKKIKTLQRSTRIFLRGFLFAPSRNTIPSLPPECLRLSWLGYQRSGQKELEIGHLLLHHQEWFLDQHDQPRVAEPKRWQMLDLLTILPEQYLTKVDRASMGHSLEVRVPFLDKPLVEAVMRLPVEVYAPGGGQKKYLLRKLMRGKLPEKTVSKKKRGFSIPLHHFFNEQILQDFIVEGECVMSGFFRRAYIDNLAAQANGRTLNRLWQIGLFEAWYKRWSRRRQGGAS